MGPQPIISSPIVLIFFNRPELTALVFDKIKDARPPKLFLISDGPRSGIMGEGARVAASRNVVADIDWPCEVFINYSEANLGCRKRVISGLDWVFSHVDRAIILEDDCVPNNDFFRFTDELLEHFSENERVGAISGTNPLPNNSDTWDSSYFFSKMPMIWGWATWARVWKQYDGQIADWPQREREGLVAANLVSKSAIRYWQNSLDGVYKERIDTWDYQFTYHLWRSNQLAVIPSRNLISNLGFGPSATHTLDESNALSNLATRRVVFPLSHPATIKPHKVFDADVELQLTPANWRTQAGKILSLLPRTLSGLLIWLYHKLVTGRGR